MRPSDRGDPAKVIEEDSAFDPSMDDDEPTTEELVEMLRESIQQAKAGQTRPASEVMRELRQMLGCISIVWRDGARLRKNIAHWRVLHRRFTTEALSAQRKAFDRNLFALCGMILSNKRRLSISPFPHSCSEYGG